MSEQTQYPRFDLHQFDGGQPIPVHARALADGEFETPGIAFEDYRNMHIQQRKPSWERRLPTPTWAVNDSQLRQVLAAFAAKRAYIAGWQKKFNRTKTLAVIGRAEKHIRTTLVPSLEEQLRKLCAEYMVLRKLPNPTVDDRARLRKVEELIENRDTQLIMAKRPTATAAAVVYLYYRCGLDSVGVAEHVHLKPPHIRVLCYHLNRCAEDLAQNWDTRENLQRVADARNNGTSWEDIRRQLKIPVRLHTLRRALRARNLFVPRDRNVTKFDHAEIIRLRKAGMLRLDIATQIGCEHGLVDDVLRRAGLTGTRKHPCRVRKAVVSIQ